MYFFFVFAFPVECSQLNGMSVGETGIGDDEVWCEEVTEMYERFWRNKANSELCAQTALNS